MLLGDLLDRFDDETVASETILRVGGLPLMALLRARAEAGGETVGVYAAEVVRRFAAEASDETWLTLLGALARAEDPGAVCLECALAHDLEFGTDAPR